MVQLFERLCESKIRIEHCSLGSGTMLGSCKGALIVMNSPILQPGGVGHCLHWAAFVTGVLWVSFITLPLFAATSLVSVPLSDLCELVPPSGGDSSSLRAILSRAPGVDGSSPLRNVFLNDALEHCLLALNGSFLNSTRTGLLVSKVFEPLKVANRVSNATIAQLLSARNQTSSFLPAYALLQNASALDADFKARGNCSDPQWQACQVEFARYEEDLSIKIDAIKASAEQAKKAVSTYVKDAEALQSSIVAMTADVDDMIAVIMQRVLALGSCSGITAQYEAVRRTVCPSGDSDGDNLATGLESLWASLILISAAWFPLCVSMCQAIKHALQVRNGRVGVCPPKESVSGKQQGQDKEGQKPQSDIIPGLVSDDSASVVGAAAGGHSSENARMRLVLGGPYGRTEDYERRRVCREVHDGLASCLDFPPDWLTVTPVGCNESGFVVDIVICLGEVNSAAMNTSKVKKRKSGRKRDDKDENTERQRKLECCIRNLLEQAADSKGPFRTSLAGRKSLWRRCMDPWRGCFPRQPLFAATSLQVVDPWLGEEPLPPQHLVEQPPAAQRRVSAAASSDLLFHFQQPAASQIEHSADPQHTVAAAAPLVAPGPSLFDSKGAPSAPCFSIASMRTVEQDYLSAWESRNNKDLIDRKPQAMQGKPAVTRSAIIPVPNVPDLTEWRPKTVNTRLDENKAASLVLDGSILWPTPGVSGLEGLRLLDPEDSIFYNPARAMEELGQIGHTSHTRNDTTADT